MWTQNNPPPQIAEYPEFVKFIQHVCQKYGIDYYWHTFDERHEAHAMFDWEGNGIEGKFLKDILFDDSYWTGSFFMFQVFGGPEFVFDSLHEICHFLVAVPEQRKRVNFGLGTVGTNGADGDWHKDESLAYLEEQVTATLQYLLCESLGIQVNDRLICRYSYQSYFGEGSFAPPSPKTVKGIRDSLFSRELVDSDFKPLILDEIGIPFDSRVRDIFKARVFDRIST